jgi:hypothetical protein
MKKTLLGLLGALACAGCGSNSGSTASDGKTNAESSSANPITAPVDYLGAVAKARKNADTTLTKVDTESLNRAVSMFNVEKGRNPKDLNELVESQVIPRLPKLPEGMQFSYDPQSGKVSVVKKPE